MGWNCLNYQIVCDLQYAGLLVMFRQTAMTSVTASDICLTAALFTFYANTETCYLCHKGRGKTCGTWSWVSCHLQGKLTCSCMLSTFVSCSWSFSWLSCCFLALLGEKYSISVVLIFESKSQQLSLLLTYLWLLYKTSFVQSGTTSGVSSLDVLIWMQGYSM